MSLMILCALSATDTSVKEFPRMQRKSMLNAVGFGNDDNLRDLLRRMEIIDAYRYDGREQNYCKWKGVTCDNTKAVERIHWRDMQRSKCDLRWIPQTVHTLIWHAVALQHINFSIQMLPREIWCCRLTKLDLHGTPDFTDLPPKLEEIDLEWNELQGTINLTSLTDTIKVIVLSGNPLSAFVVDNETLPPNLEKVRYFGHKLKMVKLSGGKMDSRISLSTY